MKWTIFAVLGGIVTWVLVASLLNRGLRTGLAGYALAEPTMTFYARHEGGTPYSWRSLVTRRRRGDEPDSTI